MTTKTKTATVTIETTTVAQAPGGRHLPAGTYLVEMPVDYDPALVAGEDVLCDPALRIVREEEAESERPLQEAIEKAQAFPWTGELDPHDMRIDGHIVIDDEGEPVECMGEDYDRCSVCAEAQRDATEAQRLGAQALEAIEAGEWAAAAQYAEWAAALEGGSDGSDRSCWAPLARECERRAELEAAEAEDDEVVRTDEAAEIAADIEDLYRAATGTWTGANWTHELVRGAVC